MYVFCFLLNFPSEKVRVSLRVIIHLGHVKYLFSIYIPIRVMKTCKLFSILIFCFLIDFSLEKLNVALRLIKTCRLGVMERVTHASNIIIEFTFKDLVIELYRHIYLFNLDIFSHIEDLLFEYVCRGC